MSGAPFPPGGSRGSAGRAPGGSRAGTRPAGASGGEHWGARSVNVRAAWGAIRAAPGRYAFVVAGLTVGVAAIVALVALTLRVREEALRQFEQSGLDVLVLRPVAGAEALEFSLLEEMAAAVPGVNLVAPVIVRRAPVSAEGRAIGAQVLGVTEAWFELHGVEARTGRSLLAGDQDESFVVLGAGVATALGGAGSTGETVGREVVCEARVAVVVGALAPLGAVGPLGVDVDHAVLLPAGVVRRLAPGVTLTAVLVRFAGAEPAVVREGLTSWLQAQAPAVRVEITSAEQVVAELTRQLRLYAILLGAVGSVALVLGGFGLLNGLLLAVAERRREIGLRRALGALRGDIQAQFCTEALILSAVGGLAGAVGGLVVAAWVAHVAGWGGAIVWGAGAAGLGVALVVGLVAGLVPAWQAARLEPITAMRR